MSGDSLPRLAAIAILALIAYTVLSNRPESTNTLAPLGFLAAGYLFGDTIMRRNNK